MTLSEFIIIREGTEPVWFRRPVVVDFGKAEVRKRSGTTEHGDRGKRELLRLSSALKSPLRRNRLVAREVEIKHEDRSLYLKGDAAT
jgi:hypothetical protein